MSKTTTTTTTTTTRPFKGANVFMSRNLVPPEVFAALLDALNLNGADVFLCCDPSRNGPNDFHIISSPDHEKFEDLRTKGCNLLGPQCVLSCAKENRALPKQGFTCCLAMDGAKVLASGFDMNEKVKIEKMVTAMGGLLHNKASSDVSFVIVKNVLAAKYKWALNVLKKPIVGINWLYQCWNEHRIVPQESFRVLPFSGLTICVTRIAADERKEIEKRIIQNGGKYSPELTRACTHLISDCAEGDKYKVARKWGHIHIVTRKWFDHSVAKRACLNEESYPVQSGAVSSNKTGVGPLTSQCSQGTCGGTSVTVTSSVAVESNMPVPCAGSSDPDLEATLSQNMSSMFSDPPVTVKDGVSQMPALQDTNEKCLDDCVAQDSQSDDDDDHMYLSECRISLIGFEASELRKLVAMVRRGGGTRHVLFNDKLTHLAVGAPSEVEKKELRTLAASGVIHVVRASWLQECDREKKEVPVLPQHIAYDLLLPKDTLNSSRGGAGMNRGKLSVFQQNSHPDRIQLVTNSCNGISSKMEKDTEGKPTMNVNGGTSLGATARIFLENPLPVLNAQNRDGKRMQDDSSGQNVQRMKSLTVFKGKTFCFSRSFTQDRRAEIVEWVSQGGGLFVDDHVQEKVNFTVESHGVRPSTADCPQQTTLVSSHWVRSCLEDGCLLDVGSHIIYSPLPCQIPLPGFENLRFCVSQYEEKDRLLLRNLCFVLGAKFVEKLTRKVTHLLCKFTIGPKYEAACKWGIRTITAEWIYECIRQNEVVALDCFCPEEVTSQDQEAGLGNVSQFPTQATGMMSRESPAQLNAQLQDPQNMPTEIVNSRINGFREEAQQPFHFSKKVKLLENDVKKDLLSSGVHLDDPPSNKNVSGDKRGNDAGESFSDFADAVDDLLEQAGKVEHLLKSEFEEYPGHSHPVVQIPKNWLNSSFVLSKTAKKDEVTKPPREVNGGIYDDFSESQTESQIVGYEDDMTGRQMLIEKSRMRGSMS